MKAVIAFLAVALAACSSTSSSSGPAACVAAGGKCVLGGNSCANRGPQDCNPGRNPGGAFAAFSCPSTRPEFVAPLCLRQGTDAESDFGYIDSKAFQEADAHAQREIDVEHQAR